MNILTDKLYAESISITNNIDKYISKGYDIKYDINNNVLIVKYNNKSEYTIKIIQDNNELYWYLEPYNNTYYTTLFENGFDMVLFAIKENETLYQGEK